MELASSQLKLTLSYTLTDTARLTVQPMDGGPPVVENASVSLVLEDGSSLNLSTVARPTGQVELQPVEEAGLGPGLRAKVGAWIARLGLPADLEVTLFERGPYFTYRVALHQTSDPGSISYLEGTFFPGEGLGRVTYLTDNDAVEKGVVPEGEIEVPIGHGKPLLLRDHTRSLLMAVLDPSDAGSTFVASATGSGISFKWQQRYSTHYRPDSPSLPPRLLVQVVDGSDLREALAPYRALTHALYPPAPLPSWFRHQWISWYLYGMDIDESKLKSQIDYIAANLNDLGPWSILIDAGWYVAEGRPDSDWRNVDGEKFPSGLRSLVDYAHQRGIKVVLYFSASYLDDRQGEGNWLGLKGIIDEHPDWLVPIESGNPWNAYHYDYSNRGFQDYLRLVLRDFFVEYGVDGIKVDGMEDSRLAVEGGLSRGIYSASNRPVLPTTSVYAFIHKEASALRPDVYVEAGWRLPAFAAPYYTVARQSDDTPDFHSGYPAPGLRDHVDYAIVQRELLGQRPHLGNYWGDPNGNSVGLQWLESGLALDAPVVLGFDLPSMSADALSEYRSRLSQLRPFSGQTRVSSGLYPDSFSATVNGTTFLAVFNRSDQQKEMRAELAEHGISGSTRVAGYDVTWGHPLPVRGAVMASVEPRTLRLFVLRTEPGVLWSNSGFRAVPSVHSLALEMSGPPDLEGFAYVAVPRPTAVSLNGERLGQDQWSYDDQAGVMKVDYPHTPEGPTRIEIRY